MREINNIRGLYNVNTKKTRDKLTFEIGEQFLARILSEEDSEGMFLIKLLDGWKFSAKFKNSLDFLPQGLGKFEVEGFEDGELVLKLLSNEVIDNKTGDMIEEFLKNNNMDLSEKDYETLNGMVKHGIPLTKDNISYIKTLSSFIERFKSENNIDEFIHKYLDSKNITLSSNEGQNIQKLLKGFFGSLTKLKLNDILTLYENNIDISKENIDSFVNIFKKPSSLFNELKNLQQNIENVNSENDKIPLDTKKINVDGKNLETKQNISIENTEEINSKNEQTQYVSVKDNAKVLDVNSKNNETTIVKNEKNNIDSNVENNIEKSTESNEKPIVKENTKESNTLSRDGKEVIKIDNKSQVKSGELNYKDSVLKSKDQLDATKGLIEEVKNEVQVKTQEMKNIIKDLMDKFLKTESKNYDKVLDLIKNNINDFKMFNSLSNEYYYLDIPMNIRENPYECKLIIKDERKKGKKIDTKNVKIAASVKTINMGVVDAFIKVNNAIMEVGINCNKNWMDIMEKNKVKLIEILSGSNYSVFVNVEEKKEEFNLTSCREFFDDNYLSKLNVKV